MTSIKFVLINLNCGACLKISQMKISKLPGVKNVSFKQRGSEADGQVEADRDITLEEIQQSLKNTPYQVRSL